MITKVLIGVIVALGLLNGLQWFKATKTGAALAVAESSRDRYKNALDLSQQSRAVAAQSALEWEALFKLQESRWKAERAELARIAKEGSEAAERAKLRAIEADRALRTWVNRYAAEVRAPACAKLLDTPLDACPGLLKKEAQE